VDSLPGRRTDDGGDDDKDGHFVLGLASVAAGIMDLVWRDFEAAHQPIQAFGDHIPGRELLAFITAAWLIAGGIGILMRRTAQSGAVALGLIYLIFAIPIFPRFPACTMLNAASRAFERETHPR
jgi:uncharacterized membrane protein YphA (DoxX/SURF4 family)